MTVIIRRKVLGLTPNAPELVAMPNRATPPMEMPMEMPSMAIDIPKEVPIAKQGIPRGRNYLRSRRSGYKKHTETPKKPIDNTPNTSYNTSIEPESFIDISDEYYDKYRCLDCLDTKKIIVYDTCEYCDGSGCRKCNNTGELKSYITCQTCKK